MAKTLFAFPSFYQEPNRGLDGKAKSKVIYEMTHM